MSDIRYWTTDADSTRQIAERILKAGDGARLRIFPHGTDNSLTFRVLPKDASAASGEPDLNHSFPCPPACGD